MRSYVVAVLCTSAASLAAAEPPAWSMGYELAFKSVFSIGPEGKDGTKAAQAAQHLATLPPEALTWILRDFHGANPLAANLLRSTVETIADRAIDKGEPLPEQWLIGAVQHPESFDGRARRLAYELVLRVNPPAAKDLLPKLLNDPNPELRRDGVAYWIDDAKRREQTGKSDEAKAAYEKALSGAIDDDQVRPIVAALKKYGVEVDLPRHFGFVTSWQATGPFDNRDRKGFDAVYPPEREIDWNARYEGQNGPVEWRPISTENDYGIVDVAKTFENYKGSAMYLAASFDSPTEQPVEFRLGTQNAWKLWLNGEFLFGREEYHRGMIMDQHSVPATLRPGKNVILLKLLQNEQNEDWAQSYNFQLRVTDPSGRAVHSTPN